MFDSTKNRAAPDSRSRNRWMQTFAISLMLCAISIGSTMSKFLAQTRDAAIAPRQQSATGVITSMTSGNGSTYYYRFPYRGAFYNDSSKGDSGERSAGDQVVVYFDPDNPLLSSLNDFHASSLRHGREWKLLLAFSVILASFAAYCWPRTRKRKREADKSSGVREV